MKFDILHEVPGRIRVHCQNLSLDPANRIELTNWVAEHPEIQSAAISARTGNLLVTYRKTTPSQTIRRYLEDLRLFEMATIGNACDTPPVSMAAAVSTKTGKTALRALIASLIPKPLQKLLTGWSITGCAYTLYDKLANRQFTTFLFELGKCVLMKLCAPTFTIRIVLTAAVAMVEHCLFAATPAPEEPVLAKHVMSINYAMSQTAG